MNSLKSVGIILLLISVLASGCAKSKVSIGKGEPDEEVKQCLRLYSKGNFEDAIQCLEMFKARYPNTAAGQEAELRIGDAQMGKKEYLLAAESYLAFLRLYPAHPKADYAHYRAGYAFLKAGPKAIDRDQEYLDDAIDQLRTVIKRYPGGEYTELARATLKLTLLRVAKRQFYIGRFYYRTGEYLAAVPRFRELAENYADSGLADRALYLAIISDIELRRIEEAKEFYGLLSTRYAQSKYTKRAEKKLLHAARKS